MSCIDNSVETSSLQILSRVTRYQFHSRSDIRTDPRDSLLDKGTSKTNDSLKSRKTDIKTPEVNERQLTDGRGRRHPTDIRNQVPKEEVEISVTTVQFKKNTRLKEDGEEGNDVCRLGEKTEVILTFPDTLIQCILGVSIRSY